MPLRTAADRRISRSAVPEVLRNIGSHIKKARRSRRLTLQQLAKQAKCSVSMLSKIENDKALPSLTTLHRIVEALSLNIGMLFDNANEDSRMIFRVGARPLISIASGVKLERLVPFGEEHIMQGNIHIIPPKCGSRTSLEHEGEEVGLVLEGELELTIDGRTFRLQVGDSFNFRSRRPHSYANPGKNVTRVIWINTPPTV